MEKYDILSEIIIDHVINKVEDAMYVLKITQDEIAKEIGTSREIVNRWLKRKQLPRLDLLIKLCLAVDSRQPGILINQSSLNDILAHNHLNN